MDNAKKIPLKRAKIKSLYSLSEISILAERIAEAIQCYAYQEEGFLNGFVAAFNICKGVMELKGD